MKVSLSEAPFCLAPLFPASRFRIYANFSNSSLWHNPPERLRLARSTPETSSAIVAPLTEVSYPGHDCPPKRPSQHLPRPRSLASLRGGYLPGRATSAERLELRRHPLPRHQPTASRPGQVPRREPPRPEQLSQIVRRRCVTLSPDTSRRPSTLARHPKRTLSGGAAPPNPSAATAPLPRLRTTASRPGQAPWGTPSTGAASQNRPQPLRHPLPRLQPTV
jgi:hypothetical protein